MGAYKVALQGQGIWAYIDDELEHMTFLVTRFVDAPDRDAAAQAALRLVLGDPRARSAEGHPPPVVSIDSITEIGSEAEVPVVQPGFRFYPADPDS